MPERLDLNVSRITIDFSSVNDRVGHVTVDFSSTPPGQEARAERGAAEGGWAVTGRLHPRHMLLLVDIADSVKEYDLTTPKKDRSGK